MITARRKKKIRRAIVVFCSFLLLVTIGWLFFIRFFIDNERTVIYPAFGIAIPGGYTIHGIDVSKYQYHIDWNEVKAMKVNEIQPGFAFIKATEGIKNTDPQFKRNWKKAKEAGVVRGAYHFFIGSKDGSLQAKNFINTVELEKGDFPPVLDIEQLNGTKPEQLKKEALEWLYLVEKKYGVKPIIYTNVDFYNRNLGTLFDDYPLWVAHYYQPHQPRIKRGWHFWQHSDRGNVNGIKAYVDFNVFNGDSADFRKIILQR